MSDLAQPIELSDFVAAIKDLSNPQLHGLKKKLLNSAHKLQLSNEFLQRELRKSIDNKSRVDISDADRDQYVGDIKLYSESIQENEQVIERQDERIAALDSELELRGEPTEDGSPSTSDLPAGGVTMHETLSTDNDVVDSTVPNSIVL